MKSFLLRFAVSSVALATSTASAAALLFQAPFDGSPAATVAGGSSEPVECKGLEWAEGIRPGTQALRMRHGAHPRLAYAAAGNLPRKECGTVAIWTRREWNFNSPKQPWRALFATPMADRDKKRIGTGALWFWWFGTKLRADQSDAKDRYSILNGFPLDGEWTHLAFAWRPGRVDIFVNGRLRRYISDSASPIRDARAEEAAAANLPDRSAIDRFFVGNIDGSDVADSLFADLRIYDAPLAEKEVRALFEAGRRSAKAIDSGRMQSIAVENWQTLAKAAAGRYERPAAPGEAPGTMAPEMLELVDEVRLGEEVGASGVSPVGRNFRAIGPLRTGSLGGVAYLEAGPTAGDRFAVRLRLPEGAPLCLVEIDVPDDAVRTQDMIIQPCKGESDYAMQVGVLLGGEYPNSGKILTQRCVLWTHTNDVALVAMTSRKDAPAAVAAVRVYAVKGAALPTAHAEFAAKMSHAEFAEYAEREPHAEFAESAEKMSHAEFAEYAEREPHAEFAESVEKMSHAEFAEYAEREPQAEFAEDAEKMPRIITPQTSRTPRDEIPSRTPRDEAEKMSRTITPQTSRTPRDEIPSRTPRDETPSRTPRDETPSRTPRVAGRHVALYFEDPAMNLEFGIPSDVAARPEGFADELARLAATMKFTGEDMLFYPGAWYQGLIEADGYNPRGHAPQWRLGVYEVFDREGLGFVPTINLNNIPVRPGLVKVSSITDGSLHDTPLVIHDSGKSNTGTWHDSPPNFNCMHPDVQRAVKDIVDTLVAEGAGHPSFGGVCLHLTQHCLLWWGNAKSGYNDYTVDAFCRDAGLALPASIDRTAPLRGAAYAEWLRAEPARWEEWVQWRCDQVTAFWARLAEKVAAVSPDAKLYVNNFVPPDMKAPDFPTPDYVREEARRCGLDVPALERTIPNVVVMQTDVPADYRWAWRGRYPGDKAQYEAAHAHQRELDATPGFWALLGETSHPWANQHDRYWESAIGRRGDTLSCDWLSESPWRVSTLNPAGDNAMRHYALPLRFHDALGFSKGGFLIGTYGMEPKLAAFAQAFRSLPPVVLDDLPGGTDVVKVRGGSWNGSDYVYVVNTGAEPVDIELPRPVGAIRLAPYSLRVYSKASSF